MAQRSRRRGRREKSGRARGAATVAPAGPGAPRSVRAARKPEEKTPPIPPGRRCATTSSSATGRGRRRGTRRPGRLSCRSRPASDRGRACAAVALDRLAPGFNLSCSRPGRSAASNPRPGRSSCSRAVMSGARSGCGGCGTGRCSPSWRCSAIVVVLFSLLLVEASNLLGFVVVARRRLIGGCGYLFCKLVRVLGRIQMPRHPGRAE